MFYRVDYMLAVLLAGAGLGALFGKATAAVPSARLARIYYAVTAGIVICRTIAFAWTTVAPHARFAGTVWGLAGDCTGLLFGVVFGLAARRPDSRSLLAEPSILEAFCLGIAFTFALAGVGKAFSMGPMTDFFTQSGYSIAFLKFIVIAEVFGALGILLPWARTAAWAGLTIDMFGAVQTHIHNGDPWNDSAGAIVMLIRLIVVAILLGFERQERTTEPLVGKAVLQAAAATIVCLSIAVGGSIAVRHHGQTGPATAVSAVRDDWSKVGS